MNAFKLLQVDKYSAIYNPKEADMALKKLTKTIFLRF